MKVGNNMMIFENGSSIETVEIPDTSNTICSARSELTLAVSDNTLRLDNDSALEVRSTFASDHTITRRDVCWYCGGRLFWGSDFNYDEVFGEGEGIVSYLTCSGCGAEVQYSLLDETED